MVTASSNSPVILHDYECQQAKRSKTTSKVSDLMSMASSNSPVILDDYECQQAKRSKSTKICIKKKPTSKVVIRNSISIQATVIETPNKKFVQKIRSGSDTAIGPRRCNEDEHILVDDLSAHLGSLYSWPMPSAFYAVFDGHGGSDAATYVKNNAMRFFFEDADLPQTSDIDDAFLKQLEDSHRKAFLLADRALADDCSVSNACGTTALTALVLGRHLLVANAGDCRAVLCRKGVPVQISQDHRPTYLPERRRVEELGGIIKFGYLNGELGVTRALGDWSMKRRFGSASPLSAEPDVHQILLTEDDEFFIMACDGIWDVMSNQDAVDIVRHELRQHDNPQRCATELVDHALQLCSKDNLTAIVVCFTYPQLPGLGSLPETKVEVLQPVGRGPQ